MIKRMRIAEEEENLPQLPDELIFYILSYLPLSSLFKFKSVSKLWNTLFLHPHLAFLHYRNSEYCSNLDDLTGTLKDFENEEREEVEFSISTTSSQGLYLKKFTSIHDSRYRIECSILRQTIDIPNPLHPSLCIALDFVFDSLAVKLVSVHQHGYEILSLRIGRDKTSYCWRDVKLCPENNKRRNGRIQVFFRKGVAYCIWYIDDDMEIDVLDMVNETYIGHTTLPRGGFFARPSLMDWNGQLSFVEQVKDELRVLVLNDYRKLRWDETTRIIKLNFLKEEYNSVLFYMKQDKKSFCSYDMSTGIQNTSVLSGLIESSEDVMDVIVMMMFFKSGGFFN